jgi:hypothetical protein
MTISQLAQELRERQYQLGAIPGEIIDALSDIALIDSYITCSCCGKKQVNEIQLHIAIENAKDADHFFDLCDGMSSLHKNSTEN